MRRLSLVFVALMIVQASGCATGSSRSGYSADQLKGLGEKALMAHETATSLKFLTEAESAQPRNAAIEYDLGLAYNQRGLQDQAIQHIQMALKIKPDYPEALNTLGYMYATTGQFDLAKAAFEKAMNDPFYQTPQIAALNLGQLYEKRGDTVSAMSYYRQAVKLDPNYAEAWYRMGIILEQNGKNDEAKRAYETAAHEAPEMAEPHLRLGIMSYRAGDFQNAAANFGQVERLAPFNSDTASEARKYLEMINNPTPGAAPSRYHSPPPQIQKGERTEKPASPARYGQVKADDAARNILSPRGRNWVQPPASSTRQFSDSPSAALVKNGGAPRKVVAVGGKKVKQPTVASARYGPDTAPSALTGAGNPRLREAGSSQYIVKIGTYADKARAEGMKSRLRVKGYDAVVQKDHGRAFVVQLQPVSTFSEAAVLMGRLTTATNTSPSILVEPAR